MRTIFSLMIFSMKENIKTKIYLILSIFSILMIFVSLLLTGLSGFEQPQRILVNTGIAMIELFCLVVILLNSAGLLLQDIETKSIYLALSKPVSREKYILGKYLGLITITLFNLVIMSGIHLIFIKISRWYVDSKYFLTLFTIFLKIGLISSVSLFMIITMTSQTSAVVTSLLLWIVGHFTSEIDFIINKISSLILRIVLKTIFYIIPNFQYFNIKDYFDSHYFVSKINFGLGILYWFVYNIMMIILTVYVFKNKDL
ncbi:MAG: ABC transporter permease [Endomicrobiia bacterium]